MQKRERRGGDARRLPVEMRGVSHRLESLGILTSIVCMVCALSWSPPAFARARPVSPAPVPIDTATPAGQHLEALACPSTSQCTAVDLAGEEVTFDPRSPGTPVPIQIDAASGLSSLACPSTSQCTAVDGAGREVTFDPRSPGTPVPHMINAAYGSTAVACPSVSRCTAVNNGGQAVAFDPRAPATRATAKVAPDDLLAVDCPSTSRCTAVDDGQEVTFDPTRLRRQAPHTIDGGMALSGVSCPSASQCTAVNDDNGQELTFDPAAPGAPTPRVIDGVPGLTGVSCPSASQCTAIDDEGHEVTFDPAALTVGSALAAVPLPSGRTAKITQLLARGGYSFSFAAPTPGRLVVGWHATVKHRRALIASARVLLRRRGKATIELRLTATGRKLLRTASSLKVTATESFTPTGGARASVTKAFTLRR